MGFRFRRSIRLGKGLRINLSKSGTSLSVGRRGATVNFGPKGEKVTAGLPGTGLSYSQMLNKTASGERRSLEADSQTPPARQSTNAVTWLLGVCLAVAGAVLLGEVIIIASR